MVGTIAGGLGFCMNENNIERLSSSLQYLCEPFCIHMSKSGDIIQRGGRVVTEQREVWSWDTSTFLTQSGGGGVSKNCGASKDLW